MKQIFSLLFLVCCLSINAQTDSIPEDSAANKKTIPVKINLDNPKLSVGLDFSYGYCYRKIGSKVYPEMIACRNESEKPVFLPQGGIAVHYRITNWFQLVSGIRIFKTGFDLEKSLHLSDTLETELGSACDVYHVVSPARGYLFAGFLDPRYGYFIKGYHPDTATIKFQLRYNYIDIPLKARFSLQKTIHLKRIVTSISAFIYSGLSINYLISQDMSYQIENNGTEIANNTFHGKALSYNKKYNYSFLAGTGIRYRLTARTAFELHVDAQWQQKSIFDLSHYYSNGQYVENHYRYDVGISIYTYLEK